MPRPFTGELNNSLYIGMEAGACTYAVDKLMKGSSIGTKALTVGVVFWAYDAFLRSDKFSSISPSAPG